MANIIVSGVLADYIQMSAVALLFYDILVTMDREVRYIWTRRHAGTTVMYIVARYSCVLSHLAIILIGTRWSGQNVQMCSVVYWFGSVSTALSLFATACFSAMRVFVLSRKSYWASLVVLILGLYPSAMYIYFPTVVKSVTPDPTLGGCNYGGTLSLETFRMEATSTRIASIAADLPALFVTLRHTYGTFRSSRQPLGQILLVDGSIYFGALLLSSLAEIFFLSLAVPHLPEHDPKLEAVLTAYFLSFSAALASPVTTLNVILMCRLLLRLCEASEASHLNTPSIFTSMSFTSAMLTTDLEDM